MKDSAAFRAAPWPYTKSDDFFRASDDPARRFPPNPNRSGETLGAITTPTILLYESGPHRAGGSRGVVFPLGNAAPSAVRGDPDFAGLRPVPEAGCRRLKAAFADVDAPRRASA